MTVKNPPASPLQALARNWWLALALPLLLALVGFVVGGTRPVEYTAESRVAVGSGSLSAGAIAGFPLASQQLADNYARWVNNRGVESQGTTQSDVVIAASPIPESNVVRVEAKGPDKAEVVAAADKTAKDLVAAVNGKRGDSDPEATLKELDAAAAKWGQAKADSDAANSAVQSAIGAKKPQEAVERLQKVSGDAAARSAVLQAQMDALSEKYRSQVSQGSTAADLRVVAPAQMSASTKASNQQRGALVGLALGLGLALAGAMLLERRRRGSVQVAARPTPEKRGVESRPSGPRTAEVRPVDGRVEGHSPEARQHDTGSTRTVDTRRSARPVSLARRRGAGSSRDDAVADAPWSEDE
ncbi:hypothetical protein [Arsenicicoccus dermatophilus]|uniref:hypothetical protein n=1 Tax=Arsenicicoccus dermatophilus TaxID=1076331 RepID=UPI001F4CDCFC|nr:hypothetical protein [Arsenicicoccus dermatophilus]MCH8612367.1 hypothetical protein [Arsenicicoccus dermatophilus]